MKSNKTILVVDDDDDVREAFTDALKFEGFAVAMVKNGREALEWLQAHETKQCLVLLDLMMPVMDGRAFLGIRNNNHILSAVPVIVLTAAGDCAELTRAYPNTRCLPKTIMFETLLSAINDAG